MTPRRLLRIATAMLVLFLLGHGIGSIFGPVRDEAEAATFAAMRGYRFDIMGVTRTHWDFYQGLNHYLTAALATFLLLLVAITRVADRAPNDARPMVWSLALGMAVFAVLSWTYFFPAPAVMTTVATMCLAGAALRLR